MTDAEEIVELISRLGYLEGLRAVRDATTFSPWPGKELTEVKERLISLLAERLP